MTFFKSLSKWDREEDFNLKKKRAHSMPTNEIDHSLCESYTESDINYITLSC